MRLVVVLLVLLFAGAPPALAGKPDHAEKHCPKEHDQGDGNGGGFSLDVVFSTGQRGVIHGYQVDRYGRGHCPPGLAKKNNGCLPPGQAKKRYVIGRPLPSGVEILDLPGDLSLRIGVPPRGYRYGVIDGDVVKLAVGTLLIVDAVSGLTD